MAIIRSRRRSTRPSSAIGHVSDEKPTDYNGNERATPSLRDLVRPSLVEAVCRSILVELKLALPAKKDVEGLIRAVQEPLNLAPGRSDLPAEIEQDVRQVLGGLTSVAKGIGALRTHGGDAHGREKGFRRIDPRIARLALNSASSLALFLIETWERKEHRTLRQHGDPTNPD